MTLTVREQTDQGSVYHLPADDLECDGDCMSHETLCGASIGLPGPMDEGEPTCDDCLAASRQQEEPA